MERAKPEQAEGGGSALCREAPEDVEKRRGVGEGGMRRQRGRAWKRGRGPENSGRTQQHGERGGRARHVNAVRVQRHCSLSQKSGAVTACECCT